MTIAKLWKKWGLQAWRSEAFEFSIDMGGRRRVIIALTQHTLVWGRGGS